MDGKSAEWQLPYGDAMPSGRVKGPPPVHDDSTIRPFDLLGVEESRLANSHVDDVVCHGLASGKGKLWKP